MLRRTMIALAVAGLSIALTASIAAAYTLLDYESAVDALHAVDPTIQPAANDPGKDMAVGGFKGPIEFNQFGFSAHSAPNGDDPKGQLTESDPQTFHGRWNVTCLAVVGKHAAIGLTPTRGDANGERIVSVFDGGPGGTLDLFIVDDVGPASNCAANVFFADVPIQSGNILVHDAMP
jgi:hypothetical protein